MVSKRANAHLRRQWTALVSLISKNRQRLHHPQVCKALEDRHAHAVRNERCHSKVMAAFVSAMCAHNKLRLSHCRWKYPGTSVAGYTTHMVLCTRICMDLPILASSYGVIDKFQRVLTHVDEVLQPEFFATTCILGVHCADIGLTCLRRQLFRII